MPEPTNEAHGVEIVSEAYRRWAKMGDVPIAIHPQDAYIAMGGLQLLTRHPGIDERMKKVFEKVGRVIQETICDNPEIYALAETGWDSANDVEQE